MARPKSTYIDLTGRTYGRTRVLGRAGNRGPQCTPLWRVLCDPGRGGCGAERVVPGTSLRGRRSDICKRCTVTTRPERMEQAAAHGKTLTQPIWPRVCRTCGAEFLGTARQVYCRPDHRPPRKPRKGQREA